MVNIGMNLFEGGRDGAGSHDHVRRDTNVNLRHVEIITETLCLRRAEGTKTLSSPGVERSMDEVKQRQA